MQMHWGGVRFNPAYTSAATGYAARAGVRAVAAVGNDREQNQKMLPAPTEYEYLIWTSRHRVF